MKRIIPILLALSMASAQAQPVGPGPVPITPYASGNWTPSDDSGGGLTFSNVTAKYVRNGNSVFASTYLTFPTTVDASQVQISGLPVGSLGVRSICPVLTNNGLAYLAVAFEGTQFFRILTAAGTGVANSALSGYQVTVTCNYSL